MAATKFLFIALALILLSCARMGVPPGGPEDKTPPEISIAFPEAGSVNVPLNSDVSLEFSEPVNRPAVESSLYLSPEPGKRLRYRWSGRRLLLDYLDPLPESRTIVVTVGAQAKDMQGNPLANSYTLAFSTGDHIDRGEIKGVSLMPEGAKSMTITAYLLGDTLPDPMVDAPDYRMQTDEFGEFDLNYLAPGTYRLFALEDKNFDGLWMPASEKIGTATQDVEALEGSVPTVTFSPSLQDTTPLAILRAKQIELRTINLRFNRDTLPDRIDIVDRTAFQMSAMFTRDTSSTASWFVFLDDTLTMDSATARIHFGDSTMSADFPVNAKPDTTHPKIDITYPDDRSANRVIDPDVIVVFNEPIMFDATSDSVFVKLKADTNEIAVKAEQTDPFALTIRPEQPFESGLKHVLSIPNTFVTDRSGNVWRDSLWTLTWYNYPPDSLGEITGTIRSSELGPWLVELYKLKESEPQETVFTNAAFKFAGYSQGDYRLRVIRDANGNQKFDQGSVSPFEFSEPFQWHPDTISVRPRWSAEVEILWITVAQQ